MAASPFPQHKLSKLCMRPEAWACTQDYWSVVKKARDYKQSQLPGRRFDVQRLSCAQTRGTLLCSCWTQFPRKVASSSDPIGSRYPSEYLRHIQWSQWLLAGVLFPAAARLKKMAVTSTDTHYRKKVNYLCHLYCSAVNYLCHANHFA